MSAYFDIWAMVVSVLLIAWTLQLRAWRHEMDRKFRECGKWMAVQEEINEQMRRRIEWQEQRQGRLWS